MEKKLTAVQWLIENAKGFHNAESSKAMQEQALRMEREQIEEAFANGFVEGVMAQKSGKQVLFPEQYYTQTFKP